MSYFDDNYDAELGDAGEEYGDELIAEAEFQAHHARITKMKETYAVAGRTALGATLACPVCDRRVIKKVPAQRFCGIKTPGTSTCRDRYHNMTNETRRDRANQIQQRTRSS